MLFNLHNDVRIVKKVVAADGGVQLESEIINVAVGGDQHQPETASADRRRILKDALRQSILAKRSAQRVIRDEQADSSKWWTFVNYNFISIPVVR